MRYTRFKKGPAAEIGQALHSSKQEKNNDEENFRQMSLWFS